MPVKTQIGSSFKQIGFVIEGIEKRFWKRIGVCFDTCHLFAAGWDIRSKEGYEMMLSCFQQQVGMPYVKAVHLNDSYAKCGNRVERHAPLGEGCIGHEFFKLFVNDPWWRDIPIKVETGGDWEKEKMFLDQEENQNDEEK